MSRAALPRLLFVRHGETDWNAVGRLQGQRDVPLNDRGRGQARQNGALIATRMPEAAAFDFVASPLVRARETMELVRAAMGLDPAAYRLDPVLREVSYGDWEGHTLDEIAAIAAEAYAARDRDKWGYASPNGESYADLSRRIEGWLETVERDTVVVSHGGVYRVLRGLLDGVDRLELVRLEVPQDRVYLWQGGIGRYI